MKPIEAKFTPIKKFLRDELYFSFSVWGNTAIIRRIPGKATEITEINAEIIPFSNPPTNEAIFRIGPGNSETKHRPFRISKVPILFPNSDRTRGIMECPPVVVKVPILKKEAIKYVLVAL